MRPELLHRANARLVPLVGLVCVCQFFHGRRRTPSLPFPANLFDTRVHRGQAQEHDTAALEDGVIGRLVQGES